MINSIDIDMIIISLARGHASAPPNTYYSRYIRSFDCPNIVQFLRIDSKSN